MWRGKGLSPVCMKAVSQCGEGLSPVCMGAVSQCGEERVLVQCA